MLIHGFSCVNVIAGGQYRVIYRGSQLDAADDNITHKDNLFSGEVGNGHIKVDGNLDGNHNDQGNGQGLIGQHNHQEYAKHGKKVDQGIVLGDYSFNILCGRCSAHQVRILRIVLFNYGLDFIRTLEGQRAFFLRSGVEQNAGVAVLM